MPRGASTNRVPISNPETGAPARSWGHAAPPPLVCGRLSSDSRCPAHYRPRKTPGRSSSAQDRFRLAVLQAAAWQCQWIEDGRRCEQRSNPGGAPPRPVPAVGLHGPEGPAWRCALHTIGLLTRRCTRPRPPVRSSTRELSDRTPPYPLCRASRFSLGRASPAWLESRARSRMQPRSRRDTRPVWSARLLSSLSPGRSPRRALTPKCQECGGLSGQTNG